MGWNVQWGDCMELMPSLVDMSIDLILTDIPYGEVNRPSNGLRNLDKGAADVIEFNLDAFLDQCVRICKGTIYIFCGTEQVSQIRAHLVRNKLSTRLCLWEKSNPSPMNGKHIWLSSVECCVFGKKRGATFNEHCKGCVWRFPTERNKLHSTQKPLALFKYLVYVSSKEGDVVFDPCMGSGTTGIAACSQGRNFIGYEKNYEYFLTAWKRMLDENAVKDYME